MTGATMHDCVVVMLAAGEGKRMGEPKTTMSVNGRPWLDQQLEALTRLGVEKVVVVVRAGVGTPAGVTRVENAAPERGSFSSLQLGLAQALRASPRGCFVLPLDVPAPGPAVWQALANDLGTGVLAVVPEHGGRRGHPVLLAAPLAALIVAMPVDAPESRLDVQLRALPGRTRLVTGVDDPRVLLNLNTQQDCRAYEAGWP